MSVAITEFQREAKRARDKSYRERKAKQLAAREIVEESLGPVVLEDGSPSDVTIEILTGGTYASKGALQDVMAARKGSTVTAPRGGQQVLVVQSYRDGSKLLTTDGQRVQFDELCSHTLPEGEQAIYVEIVGGPRAGVHGWAHRARNCNRLFQVG